MVVKCKRLPTVLEWEKAARGRDGRMFPWGNHFNINACNSALNIPNTTTPVNHYPLGESPAGVYDMVGNVWEWTLDEVKARGLGRKSKQVIKGGSYASVESSLRCYESSSYTANQSRADIGFRCVWSAYTP